MSKTGRWNNFVSRRLLSYRIVSLVTGFVLTAAAYGLGLFAYCDGPGKPTTFRFPEVLWLFAIPPTLGLLGLWLLTRTTAKLLTPLDRQRDGIALGRYGEPREILACVDAELGDGRRVFRIGPWFRPFSQWRPEVYVTTSWLVSLLAPGGDRLTIFRLADVVFAYRVRAGVMSSLLAFCRGEVQVAVIDRHGVRVVLPVPHAEAPRLLAEILARVPWAAGGFDPAASPDAQAGLDRITAEADRRREEYRVTGPSPPAPPP
jgi:hypothetical protein